jgi:hypothetical protein
MVGADSDRYRPRRTKPPALGSAPSALPRLETSLAPRGRSLVEGLDDPPLSGRLGLGELNEPVAYALLVVPHGIGARHLEPRQPRFANGTKCVRDHLHDVGAVGEHVPGVFAVMSVGAHDTLQPFAVDAQCAWPSRRALVRERLEPGLLDRLREACSLRAFPLCWAWPSFLIWLERPRLRVTGYPHTEIEREGERRASDGVGHARAERLEIDDVHCGVDVAPGRPPREGVEARFSQGRPHETTDVARDIPRIHDKEFAATTRFALDEPLAHPPLVRRPEGLAAEERLFKLLRLRRRQSWLRKYLHDLICERPLFCWKYRRIAVPAQTSANVLVDPRFLARDLIRVSMQVSHLLEQRLKLFVGDRHDPPGVRPPSDESFLTCPLVLLEQDATQLGQRVRAGVVERPEDALAIGDRERDDFGPAPERLLEEGARRFVDEPYELADVLVGNPQTGEIHTGMRTP